MLTCRWCSSNGDVWIDPKEATRIVLEAALRWLMENPMVPTEDQVRNMKSDLRYREGVDFDTLKLCCEWQRRMFLAPEPTVPEEVKDLVDGLAKVKWMEDNGAQGMDAIRDTLIEAFRRGQSSRTGIDGTNTRMR